MYQYLNTPASSSSESYGLPSWLSNYYSNKDAGLFGAEANKFYGGSPALAYSQQANQNPTSYSQVPSGIQNLFTNEGGPEDYGFDPGPTGTSTDLSLGDITAGIETEVTDLTADIEAEFSNISNEISSLSNYDMNSLSLGDVQHGLNSTLGRAATTAMGFVPALAPFGLALGIARSLGNAFDNVSQANMSRGMFGLQNMDFTDTVATGLGFNDFDFTDEERSDIAGIHGTIGDVGAPGANAPGTAGWDAQMDALDDGYTGRGPDEGDETGMDGLEDGVDAETGEGQGGIGDSGVSGGEGGGGDGSKVICTALKDMGMLDEELWKHDGEYGKTLPSATREGYWSWGVPTALYIRKHKWAAKAIKPVVTQVAKEMAHRVGYGKGSKIGKALLYFGLPVCNFLGSRFKKHTVTA